MNIRVWAMSRARIIRNSSRLVFRAFVRPRCCWFVFALRFSRGVNGISRFRLATFAQMDNFDFRVGAQLPPREFPRNRSIKDAHGARGERERERAPKVSRSSNPIIQSHPQKNKITRRLFRPGRASRRLAPIASKLLRRAPSKCIKSRARAQGEELINAK